MENYNISEDIKFAGAPVHFAVRNGDVCLHIKGYELTFSMLKAFVDAPLAEHVIIKMDKSLDDDIGIKIDLSTLKIHVGCMNDSFENAQKVYNECERLLGLQLTTKEDFFQKIIE